MVSGTEHKQYRNGNTLITINLSDGSKERFTEDDEFKPDFAESLDCTITYKCNGCCPFCYAGCTPKGKHADLLSDYVVNTFIPSLKPYTELALNGNDLSHPQLKDFLRLLKERKVIANLTVNQKHFMKHAGRLKRLCSGTDKLVYGLGVSYVDGSKGFFDKIQEFPNAVIHLITGIASPSDLFTLRYRGLKVLILGFKSKGLGDRYLKSRASQVYFRQEALRHSLRQMIRENWFSVLSFDNLAIEQLGVKDLLSEEDWNTFYQGEEGSFTYFVDLVNNRFAKSSSKEETIPIEGRNAVEMFQYLRSK